MLGGLFFHTSLGVFVLCPDGYEIISLPQQPAITPAAVMAEAISSPSKLGIRLTLTDKGTRQLPDAQGPLFCVDCFGNRTPLLKLDSDRFIFLNKRNVRKRQLPCTRDKVWVIVSLSSFYMVAWSEQSLKSFYFFF